MRERLFWIFPSTMWSKRGFFGFFFAHSGHFVQILCNIVKKLKVNSFKFQLKSHHMIQSTKKYLKTFQINHLNQKNITDKRGHKIILQRLPVFSLWSIAVSCYPSPPFYVLSSTSISISISCCYHTCIICNRLIVCVFNPLLFIVDYWKNDFQFSPTIKKYLKHLVKKP